MGIIFKSFLLGTLLCSFNLYAGGSDVGSSNGNVNTSSLEDEYNQQEAQYDNKFDRAYEAAQPLNMALRKKIINNYLSNIGVNVVQIDPLKELVKSTYKDPVAWETHMKLSTGAICSVSYSESKLEPVTYDGRQNIYSDMILDLMKSEFGSEYQTGLIRIICKRDNKYVLQKDGYALLKYALFKNKSEAQPQYDMRIYFQQFFDYEPNKERKGFF